MLPVVFLLALRTSKNFDNSTAPYFDQCWSSLNNTGVSFANVQANDNSFNPIRSLPNSIQFYNSSGTSGELFFISPMISDLDSTKRIRFHLNSNSSSADLIVGTMSAQVTLLPLHFTKLLPTLPLVMDGKKLL